MSGRFNVWFESLKENESLLSVIVVLSDGIFSCWQEMQRVRYRFKLEEHKELKVHIDALKMNNIKFEYFFGATRIPNSDSSHLNHVCVWFFL